MNKFKYIFINSESDEKIYTDLFDKLFQEGRDYTLHNNEDLYSGPHDTLVCKCDGIIIGGMCVYIVDEKRPDELPMERRGIELKKYIDLKNMRYAEICRVGVLQEFRKYNIYPRMSRRCLNFCIKTGCQAIFWIANERYTKHYKNRIALMGYEAKNLGLIKYTQIRNRCNPIELECYLSALFPGTEPTLLDVPATSHVVVEST